ncbi:MAG: glycosyltransferase family 2 protein [Chloroflexi bacterium]|nr:glycosyltransferase family 2 protein [Chloroflexota bacterium]MBI2983268.1 glycosyltransferase family 2 protein [Chloroflexota bacterium]
MPDRLASLSFFFPAYNEELTVEAVVREGLAKLPRFTDDIEIVVVDDGSTDRTGAIADRLAAEDARVRVVHHRPNRGYGGAVRSGIGSATREHVFFTDGDLQFDLDDLERLIPRLGRAEVVVGYREKRADPAKRLFIAWVYNTLIRILFLAPFRDVDCAFKLFKRDVFTRVPLSRVRSNGAFFSPELLLVLRAAGVRIEQVGVRHFPRRFGEEKGATMRVVLRAIRDLLRLRFRLLLRPGR